ncbi:MAG: PilZ domain-containing protein [Elusimicrobiota bacterium]
MTEKRKHKRFAATAFLNTPVYITPLPPFFGSTLKGKLIDLSAGGMSVNINGYLPQNTLLHLALQFSDGTLIEAIVELRHFRPNGKKTLYGFEFIKIDSKLSDKINQMSSEFIDCENRIQKQESNICRNSCAFFSLCSKEQKNIIDNSTPINKEIHITFQKVV